MREGTKVKKVLAPQAINVLTSSKKRPRTNYNGYRGTDARGEEAHTRPSIFLPSLDVCYKEIFSRQMYEWLFVYKRRATKGRGGANKHSTF